MNRECIIVGGGVLGVCATYFLARRGAAVTLLEAREPGAAASGGSFAWINATSKEPRPYHDLNRRGVEAYARLAEEVGGAAALGLHGGGSLRVAVGEDRAALQARCEELRAWGYPVEWLDREAMQSLEPDLRLPDDGAAGWHAVMDYWVDPSRLLATILERARQLGARIVTGCAVTAVRAQDGRVRGVTTSAGELGADAVLLAAGTWVPELAASCGVSVPVGRVPGLLALTTPLTGGLPRRVVHVPGVHARPAPGGRCLFGSSDLDERTTEDTLADPPPAWTDAVRERLARWYPALAAARIERARVCVRPMPADGFSIVGAAPEVADLYLAVTHSGITLGPFLGECIAEEMLSGERREVLAPYRPERFATRAGSDRRAIPSA